MSFYFLTEFFRYFFRVLHEASSSWLKYLYNFQEHTVMSRFQKFGKKGLVKIDKKGFLKIV
jgi:hypothetical protein